MESRLLCVLLVTALLSLASGKDSPGLKRFKDNHTYSNQNRAFNCTAEMNRKQMELTYCRPCSSIILGDNTWVTPMNNVINICRNAGTSVGVGGNLFRSNTNFRTVKCRLQNHNAAPPKCVYTAEFRIGQITLGCSQNEPVHFKSCE